MSKTKKEYLSEPINVELDWINDIRNRYIRSNMRQLDLSISITYTYFIYHDYTIAQLAKINETTERQVIIWILIAAYTLDGGEYRFGDGRKLLRNEMDMLLRRYPKAKETLPCHRCVWADLRTGRVLCFRDCKGFNCFLAKRKEGSV